MYRILKFTLLLIFIGAGFVFAQAPTSVAIRQWTINGITREATLYVPGTAKSKLTPVIFLFHGHGGNMKEMYRSHDFSKLWPEAIIVVPQGLKTPGQLVDRAGNKAGWQQVPGDSNDRDILFFDEMLSSLQREYQIDTKRIYATGHSNGGSFTYLLWAMRGGVFAAVAPSAAVAFRFNDMLKPKPVMHIMGETDLLVKPAWQERQLRTLLKVNNCLTTGEPFGRFSTLYPSLSLTPVVLFSHPGGHAYPEEANTAVISFFKSMVKL
ncbi:prolyl oligopeptidase family serine peptidase [Mucilaginibacter sp. PAMB04274]|uniref:alpha/beta hydrolase family esterase n=1 Tax=Mucilaginibacter sp. PAMB04274 TaxID=3138568 RepID=UPI0031F600D1